MRYNEPVQAQISTHTTLLERLSAGNDHAAWREFTDRYGRLILGFANRQSLQAADCDEVLQEVLLSLTKAMPGFTYDPAKGKFRSYLKTVVLHAVFKKSAQKRGATPLEDIENAPQAAAPDEQLETAWEDEWRQHHVRLAMRTIDAEFPEADRAAFQAYAVEGRAPQETADALGLNLNRVYRAKSRIARRLRELIAIQVQDEG